MPQFSYFSKSLHQILSTQIPLETKKLGIKSKSFGEEGGRRRGLKKIKL
jgi:hypothetical protein